MRLHLIAGLVFSLVAIGASASEPFGGKFSLVGDFPLGSATDRMDYQSIDLQAHRLYIAKMGDGKLLVFDIEHNKLVAQLDGFPKVTGVLAVPALHRVYASVPGAGVLSAIGVGVGMLGLSRGSGEVVVLDTASLKEIARVPGGVFPDGIAFDPADNRIFVSDEMGSAVTVIDARTNAVAGRIDAGGEVGNIRFDPVGALTYAPVQSRNELIVIDPKRLVVVARYALPGCEHPHGLALAPGRAIGYVACDENDVLVTIDLKDGKILKRLRVAHDPDVLAVDPDLKRLYVAGETGQLSTFDIAEPTAPLPLSEVEIGPNAHSAAVDPATHRLYVPLADASGKAIMRILAPR